MAAAWAAAADYRGVVFALHSVRHVDEAGFVALLQGFKRLFQCNHLRIVLGKLGDVILFRFQVYANMSGGVAVSFFHAAAAVLKNNLISLFQKAFDFAEVEYSVVCLDLNVYGDGDGALKFMRFGLEFLVRVVACVSLSHLGGHEVTSASQEI